MPPRSPLPVPSASSADVERFLDALAKTPAPAGTGSVGRLIFALDATGSRQSTWDQAARLQGDMFMAAAAVGRLAIQLCFYRGYGEFRVSPWLINGPDLVRMMTSVVCRAGETQIGKVLQHALNVAADRRVGGLVFVGDACEEEVDRLAGIAGRLGAAGVPAFLFHEGRDLRAEFAFREIARLTRGAYCRFDAGSAQQLRDLLCAVAVFAAGGAPALRALADRRGGAADAIAGQLEAPR